MSSGNHNMVQHLTGLKRRGKLRGNSDSAEGVKKTRKSKKARKASKPTNVDSDSDYY